MDSGGKVESQASRNSRRLQYSRLDHGTASAWRLVDLHRLSLHPPRLTLPDMYLTTCNRSTVQRSYDADLYQDSRLADK